MLRNILLYGAITVASVVVAVGLWIVPEALTNPPRNPWDVSRFLEENRVVQSDPDTGFLVRPNISITEYAGPHPYPVYTDHISARVDQPGQQTPGHVDLVTVGCSVSWGDGVENQETFTSLVAHKLGQSVANLSWSSFGGVQAEARIRAHLDLKPKMIIYGFFESHLDRNITPCAEIGSPLCMKRPYIDPAVGVIAAPSDQSGNMSALRDWYRATSTTTDRYRSLWTDIYWTARTKLARLSNPIESTITLQQKIAAQVSVLDAMDKDAKSIGAKFVIAYIPLYFTEINDPPDAFVQFAKERGATFVNMVPALRELKADGVTLGITGDGHPTLKVHERFAQEIIKAVANR